MIYSKCSPLLKQHLLLFLLSCHLYSCSNAFSIPRNTCIRNQHHLLTNNRPSRCNHPLSATSSSSSSSSSSASNRNVYTPSSDEQKEQAGVGGYSIMRQPLDWDVLEEEEETDQNDTSGNSSTRSSNSKSSAKIPRFDVPTFLDESKDQPNQMNSDWFGSRRVSESSWIGGGGARAGEQRDDSSSIIMGGLGIGSSTRNTNTGTGTGTTSTRTSNENHDDVLDRYSQESWDSADTQELNIFQRTMDALDYPTILKALKEECGTTSAQFMIDSTVTMYNNNQDITTTPTPTPTTTTPSKRLAKKKKNHPILSMGLTAQNVDQVHERYEAIQEMNQVLDGKVTIEKERNSNISNHPNKRNSNRPTNSYERKKKFVKVKMGPPPVTSNDFNIQPLWDKIDEGRVLDGPDIFEASAILNACISVREWCMELETANNLRKKKEEENGNNSEGNVEQKRFLRLPRLGQSIYIDDGLRDLLSTAFDESGNLSGVTFPEVGRLRAKVQTLKRNILGTLDTLLNQSSLKSKVSLESGGALYSEVNSRIVIPISDNQAKSVSGITHVYSRSKKTAYVEPTEIVGPTNEMRQAELQLKQEESRVWRMLTTNILEHREDIECSIAAVAQIDLVMARIRLGQRIEGVIPQVKDEGVISLQNARHPVLLLRELDNVVGSDINIGDGSNQGLILTGPNSGGKTVVLKLLGLISLMVKDGIPVPAVGDTNRVDFFETILADIGDIQSLDGDLSTFSGHMLVCREVLANSKKNALVMMDELGSGTNPKEGVAISIAILEALIESGSRVAITTHYLELKQLALSDDRFLVGGMQFLNNKPTYKLLMGVVGESFALSVAERLKLPPAVIERATELLDVETRQMGDLLREIESQKTKIDTQVAELEAKRVEMNILEEEMNKEKEKLEKTKVSVRRKEAQKFAKKLEEKEKLLETILNNLKSDPSKKVIARSWDEVKYIKREAIAEADNVPSVLRMKQAQKQEMKENLSELIPLSQMKGKPNLQPGDKVIIMKKGAMRGKEASVVNMRGKQVNISMGTAGMTIAMKLSDISMPITSSQGNDYSKDTISSVPGGKGLSKMARKALAEEGLDEESSISRGNKNSKKSNGVTMRLDSNTIDVLGCNFEEARRKIEDKFSKTMTQKQKTVWILHGHGTGVLKQKIRNWLRMDKSFVKKWKPAEDSDGGDAFTMVEVKPLLL